MVTVALAVTSPLHTRTRHSFGSVRMLMPRYRSQKSSSGSTGGGGVEVRDNSMVPLDGSGDFLAGGLVDLLSLLRPTCSFSVDLRLTTPSTLAAIANISPPPTPTGLASGVAVSLLGSCS